VDLIYRNRFCKKDNPEHLNHGVWPPCSVQSRSYQRPSLDASFLYSYPIAPGIGNGETYILPPSQAQKNTA